MTFLFMLICLYFIFWVIKKVLLGHLFDPPTRDEYISEQKSQEGNVQIYRDDSHIRKANKPKIEDLGEYVDFEEE